MNTTLSNAELKRFKDRYLHDDRGQTNDPDTEGYGYDTFQMFRDLEQAEAALRDIRIQAEERVRICIASTNVKGALEVAVTGLWNIEADAHRALRLEGPNAVERLAASTSDSPTKDQEV